MKMVHIHSGGISLIPILTTHGNKFDIQYPIYSTMNNMPLHYNQTRNQLLIIYLRNKKLINGLETNGGNYTDNTEWEKIESNEKTKKKLNQKKTKYTIRDMCASR